MLRRSSRQESGSSNVVVYVPSPEALLRSTGALMLRHEASRPSASAVRAKAA